jgi:DNA polymerase-3 subunit gamma/tau
MAEDDLTPEEELVERDDATAEMFGAPVTAPPAPSAEASSGDAQAAYQVLARKYRPRTFEDLIGQEAMVRTLANAFASGRIAHAFMLTGVRGVGKTTTARLLARALNYETDQVHRPSVELTTEGRHCRAIIEGRHMDVLELDAASRTKVDEMRELLDGARYAPVEARYKVYVIDEVHMLSTASFNALLKTLEEPPPHVKFIFATTEIRKVPVTILSRCQRFDLRRVEPDVLVKHLQNICTQEGALVEDEGLALISRAAEGSVRDALSLLDQAIVQGERGQITPASLVRDMLGLADRAATIGLFETVMKGDVSGALTQFRSLYSFGADPVVVVGDLLEHAHGSAVAKMLGPDALGLPKDQAGRLAAIGAEASAGTLSRMWQMLLKAHEEARRAPDPMAAVEMALIRLGYVADLPGPEEALKRLQSGESLGGGAPSAPAPPQGGGARAAMGGGGYAQGSVSPVAAPAAKAMLATFQDVVGLIETKRDITLKLDVERYVRLVDFKPGVIAFEPAPGAPSNLSHRLASKLKEWTGDRWMMEIRGGGAETSYERERREEREERTKLEAEPFVRSVLDAFPGAEILSYRKHNAAVSAEAAPVEDDDGEEA